MQKASVFRLLRYGLLIFIRCRSYFWLVAVELLDRLQTKEQLVPERTPSGLPGKRYNVLWTIDRWQDATRSNKLLFIFLQR